MITTNSQNPAGLLPKRPNSTRPDIEHWWAVEAMIASYNHVYQVTYKTRYELRGSIGVSVYDGTPIASFQYEFLALSADSRSVLDSVSAYPLADNKKYVIDVFHPKPTSPELKHQYGRHGYEFIRTSPVLGFALPPKIDFSLADIHKATTIRQAESANHTLTTEGERLQVATLRDKQIHSFYVKVGGEAVGWIQLVTVYPEVGYINQLHVLEAHRGRNLGTALIQRAHLQARELGLQSMVLVPSAMAIPLYRRLGYRPLLYFSVFRPM
jgi:GNAT superfamily N-acetyltransferase